MTERGMDPKTRVTMAQALELVKDDMLVQTSGRTWINSSTLLGRANVVGRLMRDDKTRFGGGDLETYFKRLGATSSADIVATLLELTVAVPVPPSARDRLVDLIKNGSGSQSERIAEAIHAMATLPEFQLG